jgi:nucleoside-diphosphate-sugar epimerase
MTKRKVYVAGHRGMVGSAIVRALQQRGYIDIITRTHGELDLTNQRQVHAFFQEHQIDEVYLAAARVGGIHANNRWYTTQINGQQAVTDPWVEGKSRSASWIGINISRFLRQ